LTVSIVTYRPDLALLDRTLRTLAASLVAAREQELMRAANVVLIDNTGTRASAAAVIKVAESDVTGCYFKGAVLAEPSDLAMDATVAARLWEVSSDLTGMRAGRI